MGAKANIGGQWVDLNRRLKVGGQWVNATNTVRTEQV